MAGTWGTIRGRIITPSASSGSFEKRGFHIKSLDAREALEKTSRMFMNGYAYAAAADTVAEAQDRIAQLPWQFRGFAYEGAAMGYAVRDGMPVGNTRHVTDLLAGRTDGHIYMIHFGVGWAMARLPRFRWKTLGAAVPNPLFRWLVLDGYGFHQAYFKTNKYVRRQYREPRFPWPGEGPDGYANRVIDQGIGRAMWFVGGADPNRVADMIDRFPESRRADLYAGSGLVATYAGAANEGELLTFLHRAGTYAPQVAQGSVFAAAARVETGLVTEHTGLATRVLAGVTPEQAAKIFHDARPASKTNGDTPLFELWRQHIIAAMPA
ncbi:MAG TPA: DUF1702 family protein [Actinocrinis sp.]|uniref:DUF1702 family protein n=1 Tax=Actinocrinis sp. TaxID=1920516 RepID=UPI002DDD2299|nr:DUF1702 family protein [Actinocrinis sp.]HEV2342457.1 DUF1702 family protein [Actinocrinis sp.]